MSAEETQPSVVPAANSEDVYERRQKLDLKTWLVKAFAVTVMGIFGSSTMALIYAAVVQEKDLNTGFIGETLKTLFDFLRFVLA